MNIKNIALISFGALFDSLLTVTFISVWIVGGLKEPALISIAFVLRRILRIFLDIPIAKVVDKYIGLKSAMTISIFIKFFAVCSLFIDSKISIFVYVILEGLSISFKRGKVNVFRYNVFVNNNKPEDFVKFESYQFVFLYIASIFCSFVGGLFYAKFGRDAIIVCSIVMLVCVYLLLIYLSRGISFIPPKSKLDNIGVKDPVTLHKIGISMMLAVSMLAWTLSSVNVLLHAHEYSDSVAPYISGFGIFCMLCGSLINVFINKYFTMPNISTSSKLFILTLSCNVIFAFVCPHYISFIPIGIFLLYFVIYENIATAYLLSISSQGKCVTLSLSTTILSIIAVITLASFPHMSAFVDLARIPFIYLFSVFCVAFIGYWLAFYKTHK